MDGSTILLGGEHRPVAYTFGALRAYERNTKRSFIGDMSSFSAGVLLFSDLVVDVTLAILQAGTKWEEPPTDYTKEQVEDWLDDLSMPEAQAIIANFSKAISDEEVEKKTGVKANPWVATITP